MGLADSDLCNKCKTKETIVHLYWDCTESQKLWNGISNLLHDDKNVKPNKRECLVGKSPAKSNRDQLADTISLVCRYYIHLMKCKNQQRNLQGLLNTIKNIMNVETNIYQGNPGKLRKWSPVKELLK
jgi:hypothetical protein